MPESPLLTSAARRSLPFSMSARPDLTHVTVSSSPRAMSAYSTGPEVAELSPINPGRPAEDTSSENATPLNRL